jgi:hypothetical protein
VLYCWKSCANNTTKAHAQHRIETVEQEAQAELQGARVQGTAARLSARSGTEACMLLGAWADQHEGAGAACAVVDAVRCTRPSKRNRTFETQNSPAQCRPRKGEGLTARGHTQGATSLAEQEAGSIKRRQPTGASHCTALPPSNSGALHDSVSEVAAMAETSGFTRIASGTAGAYQSPDKRNAVSSSTDPGYGQALMKREHFGAGSKTAARTSCLDCKMSGATENQPWASNRDGPRCKGEQIRHSMK